MHCSTRTPFAFAAASRYQADADSGLTLVGHRYYDAGTGRFLTRDPEKYGRNWFSYCLNNPMRFLDPTGLWSWQAIGVGLGIIVGVGIIIFSGGTAVPILVSVGVVGIFGAGGSAIGAAADGRKEGSLTSGAEDGFEDGAVAGAGYLCL